MPLVLTDIDFFRAPITTLRRPERPAASRYCERTSPLTLIKS